MRFCFRIMQIVGFLMMWLIWSLKNFYGHSVPVLLIQKELLVNGRGNLQ